jgi:hypothetical protein
MAGFAFQNEGMMLALPWPGRSARGRPARSDLPRHLEAHQAAHALDGFYVVAVEDHAVKAGGVVAQPFLGVADAGADLVAAAGRETPVRDFCSVNDK